MASVYNYKQFEDAARAAGLFDQFSEADLLLAQKNPDAGMSILKYKQDYANATTDAARALANQGAEGVRSSYGNYTGGGDGGSFHVNTMSPSSFTYKEAPTFTSRYDAEAEKLMQAILNREKFSYNPETDPLYGSYKKQYTREGQRATQDAIGAAAAATGGIPSSYAVTAATQAGDYYAAQMADKIPELEQLAYSKYMNDYQMKLSDLDMIRAAEQNDYAKFLDQLEQHNADRSFAYGQHIDEIDSQTAERAEALERALMAAQYGDYSFLEKMGVTPDIEAMSSGGDSFADLWDRAMDAAKQGDSRLLAALGVDTGYDARQKEFADVRSDYPDGVLDADTWDILVGRYGEDVVKAAGFTKAEEHIEPPTMDENGIAEDIEAADEETYQGMVDDVRAMVRGGASAEEVLAYIDGLWNSRLVSQEQVITLRRIANQTKKS